MPVPGNPVAPLVVGQTFTVQAPITPSTGQQWVVELDNVSPYPLTIGGSIASSVLPPMQSNTYTAHSGPAGVTVTVNAPFDNSTPPAGVPAYLTNTWAILPDTIQGVYPMAIPPTTLVSGQQQYNAGTFTVTNPVIQAVTVPTWAQSMFIVLKNSSMIFQVFGTATNAIYRAWDAGSSTTGTAFQGAFACPVAPEIDPQVNIQTWNPGGPATSTFTVGFTSGAPIPFPRFSSRFTFAGMGTASTVNLLSPSPTTVYAIDNLTVQSTAGAAGFGETTVHLASLLSGNATLQVIADVWGQAGQTAVWQLAPALLTFPGTTVQLTTSGTSPFFGSCSLAYRQLTP